MAVACQLLDSASSPNTVTRLGSLNKVVDFFLGGSVACKNVWRELFNFGGLRDDLSMQVWNYQACTSIPMMPLSTDFLGFFPPQNRVEMESLKQACLLRVKSPTARPRGLRTAHWSVPRSPSRVCVSIFDADYFVIYRKIWRNRR